RRVQREDRGQRETYTHGRDHPSARDRQITPPSRACGSRAGRTARRKAQLKLRFSADLFHVMT
ncbi:MAG: hypothetical protein AAB975_01980, partial [Patescibacteria group bacterium]